MSIQANQRGAIGSDVVLIGSKLTTLRGHTLQLLLGWGVGVANVHKKTLITKGNSGEFLDDFVTDITRLESIAPSAIDVMPCHPNLPSKPNSAAVAHAISENLAGQDCKPPENGSKLLGAVSAAFFPRIVHANIPLLSLFWGGSRCRGW